MTLTVRRRPLVVVVVAAMIVCLAGSPASARRRGEPGKVYAVVAIDHIGSVALESLKRRPAVDWWVELDDQLLVCGDASRLRADLGGSTFHLIDKPVRTEN